MNLETILEKLDNIGIFCLVLFVVFLVIIGTIEALKDKDSKSYIPYAVDTAATKDTTKQKWEMKFIPLASSLGIQYDLEVENALNEKDYSNLAGVVQESRDISVRLRLLNENLYSEKIDE